LATKPKNETDLLGLQMAHQEMIAHGLYVFGGHHTQQALTWLLNMSYANKIEEAPEVWRNWPAVIFGVPRDFGEFSYELDCISELDNEPIALKVELKDRFQRFRRRWEKDWQSLEHWQKATTKKKEEWVAMMQRTLPRSKINTAYWISNMVAVPESIYERIKHVIMGGYRTKMSGGGKKKRKKDGEVAPAYAAPPLTSFTRLKDVMNLSDARKEQLLDHILEGKIDLKEAEGYAKKIRCRLRFKNFIVREFRERASSDVYEGQDITFDWLVSKNILELEGMEDNYYFFFKKNTPDKSVEKALVDAISIAWNKFLASEGQVQVERDFLGTGWLKQGHPGHDAGSSLVRLFSAPRSRILLINCKAEELGLFVIPRPFRKFIFLLCLYLLVFLHYFEVIV
jgi:hypothetical protein